MMRRGQADSRISRRLATTPEPARQPTILSDTTSVGGSLQVGEARDGADRAGEGAEDGGGAARDRDDVAHGGADVAADEHAALVEGGDDAPVGARAGRDAGDHRLAAGGADLED